MSNKRIFGFSPAAFEYVPPIYYTIVDTFVPRIADYNNTTYARMAVYPYPGSGVMSMLASFQFVGNKDSGVTSYDIKIEDITNAQTLCEKNFTNNSEMYQSISPFVNVPTINIFFLILAHY